MSQNKCYICHNIRHKEGKDKELIAEVRDDIKLIPEKFSWTMFDGEKVTIDIFKCERCHND